MLLLQVGVVAGLASVPQLSGGVPRGYVRLLVFDADSNLISQQTQQLSAAALNNYEALRLQVVMPQDGYVTAYVGNESNVDVFFDDVQVEHRQGLQVQETQYDPTGLELAGLTRETPGLKPLNQYKFNGKEFQTDLGLNWNHQDWRFFDAQVNRWHVVDPEIENEQESWGPYSFGFDNAVRYADADGRNPGGGTPFAQLVMPPPGIVEETVQTLQEVAVAVGLTGAAIAVGAWVTDNMHSVETLEEVFKGGGDAGMPAGLEVPLMRQWVLNSSKSGDNLSRTGRPLPKSQTNGGRAMDPKTKQPIGGDGKNARPVTVNKGTFKQAKDAARNDRANGGRGTPVKHTKDKKGGKHFHNGSGVEGKGKESKDYGNNAGKVSNNVHYHYPKNSSN